MKTENFTGPDSEVSCVQCGFTNGLHPLRTVCTVQRDGDGPIQGLVITQDGNSQLAATTKFENTYTNGDYRKRELDTNLIFWCEGCHKLSEFAFEFHKGMVFFSRIKRDEPFDINKVFEKEKL